MVVLLAHVSGEAIMKTLKIHNLSIQHPNNKCSWVLESSWKFYKTCTFLF